jgi:hypothetical protein
MKSRPLNKRSPFKYFTFLGILYRMKGNDLNHIHFYDSTLYQWIEASGLRALTPIIKNQIKTQFPEIFL